MIKIIVLSIFGTGESVDEIVEVMCLKIKNKKHCISDEELSKMVVGMYLNIVEFIDIDKQEELMEMILMKEETQGIIAQLKNEGFNEGRDEAFDEFKEDQLDYFSDSPFYEEILEYFHNYSLNHQI